jgi:uncharacterized protein YndB with AHSA1/START domain
VARTVSVAKERLIAADPAAVWFVVSNPAMHERLDARSRLESTVGNDGQIGSEYVVVFSAGAKFRIRYVIVDAEPNVRLVAAVSTGGTKQEQRADIWPTGEGTLLRFTVTLPAPWFVLTRRTVTRAVARQMEKWLSAVEREALLVSR